MNKTQAELMRAACAAREKSYAPYSKFRVGAAVQGENGEVFTGANVENASFGLSICAERVAVFRAVNAGNTRLTSIAICTDSAAPTPPCGACRQVLMEFAPDMMVLIGTPAGQVEELPLQDLLARPFRHFDSDHAGEK